MEILRHNLFSMQEVFINNQGCILSPLLFNLYINGLPYSFEDILSDPFVLPNGIKLSSLLYADDLIILSRSKAGLMLWPSTADCGC